MMWDLGVERVNQVFFSAVVEKLTLLGHCLCCEVLLLEVLLFSCCSAPAMGAH